MLTYSGTVVTSTSPRTRSIPGLLGVPESEEEAMEALRSAAQQGFKKLGDEVKMAKRMMDQGHILGPTQLDFIYCGRRILRLYREHKVELIALAQKKT